MQTSQVHRWFRSVIALTKLNRFFCLLYIAFEEVTVIFFDRGEHVGMIGTGHGDHACTMAFHLSRPVNRNYCFPILYISFTNCDSYTIYAVYIYLPVTRARLVPRLDCMHNRANQKSMLRIIRCAEMRFSLKAQPW